MESRTLLATVLGDDQIVFTSDTDPSAVFYMNSDGSGVQKIPTHEENVFEPVLSPDRTRILFWAYPDNDNDAGEVFAINVDGTAEQQLTSNSKVDIPHLQPDAAGSSSSPSATATAKST